MAWTLDCPSPLCRLVYLPEPDTILAWTYRVNTRFYRKSNLNYGSNFTWYFQGELVMVDVGKNPKLTLLKYYGTNSIDMDLIYPDGNTIVSVNTNDELQVWDKENGHLVFNSLSLFLSPF